MVQKTTKLVIGMSALIILATCTNKKIDSHLVSITISSNKSIDSMAQVLTTDLLDFDAIKLSESKVDSSGNAVLEFALDHPVFAYLRCGDKFAPLFISPHDNLKISLDSLAYSGDGAAIDDYLVKSAEINNYDVVGGKNSRDLEPGQFLDVKDSIKQAYKTLLGRTKTAAKLKDTDVQILETAIEMGLLYFQQNYVNGRFGGDLDDPNIPASIKKNLTNIPLDTIALKSNSFYYGLLMSGFVQSKIHSAVYEENETVEPDSVSLLADLKIRKSKFPDLIKEFLLAKNISYWVNMEGITPELDAIYNRFISKARNSQYVTSLKKSHDKWLAIAPGKLAPDFAGKTADGQKISLSDLKGKIIYVDVWATWCGPCKEEFPHSREMEKTFEGNKNVAFLFVSIDQDIDSWKKMVSKGNVPRGIHMNQKQDKQPDAIWEAYHIWGIPRYILIDQEGKIVQTHAYRPSSGKVPGLIRELLNSKKLALK